jgi:hypothetical protein
MTDYQARCDDCGHTLPEVVYKACEAVAFYVDQVVECPRCTGHEWTFEAQPQGCRGGTP